MPPILPQKLQLASSIPYWLTSLTPPGPNAEALFPPTIQNTGYASDDTYAGRGGNPVEATDPQTASANSIPGNAVFRGWMSHRKGDLSIIRIYSQ